MIRSTHTGWLKSQTMLIQIAIHTILILFAVILITIGLFQFVLTVLIPILEESQQQMFFNGVQNQQNNVLRQQLKLMTEYVDLNSNKLISLHQLVLAAEQKQFNNSENLIYDFQGIKSFPPSLSSNKYVQLTTSFFCASNKSQFKENRNYEEVKGISNVIGTIGLLLDSEPFGQSTVAYGAIYNDPQIVYTYPCINLGKAFNFYKPEDRSWHIKAKELFNQTTHEQYETKLGEPFIRNQNEIEVSLVIPQVNSMQQFIGAWAIDMQGSVFTKYLAQQHIEDMMLLVDKNGILLVHNFHNPDLIMPLYIYNESVTGYSLNDWEAIHHNRINENNCDAAYSIPGYLCRYNSVQHKHLHVFIQYLYKYELYIIMLSDQSSIKTEISYQTLLIEEFIQDQSVTLLWNMIGLFFVAAIIASIVLKIAITSPIVKVIRTINSNFKPNFKDRNRYSSLIAKIYNSDHVSELLLAFNHLQMRLANSLLKQGLACQQIQSIQYPKKYIFGHISVSRCLNTSRRYYTPSMWLYKQKKHLSGKIGVPS